ncbi:MAG: hypothetical protein LRY40_03560 [Shewanella fodinae]|nr:hypothetical protein [Shewanella fodinae]
MIFALQLLALLTNEQLAQATELTLEYDPQPPYHTGSPKSGTGSIGRGIPQRLLAALSPN